MRTISLLDLANASLRLVGEYSITTASEAANTAIFSLVRSALSEAFSFVFDDLRSIANREVITMDNANIVGDNYELVLPSNKLYTYADSLKYKGSTFVNFNNIHSTTPCRFERRPLPVPNGSTVFVCHKDLLLGKETEDVTLSYFWKPNVNQPFSSTVTIPEVAVSAVTYRVAQTVSIPLTGDVTLAQVYARLAEENKVRVAKENSTSYRRPYFARIVG